MAAQMLGAVDEFHVRTEGPRDRLAARAREEALQLMLGTFPLTEQRMCMSHGGRFEETQLVSALEAALSVPPGATLQNP